jgi:hypothetical protein
MPPLRQLADNLWETSRPVKVPGLRIDHRMTVARLASGELWIHSPIAFDEELSGELTKLGRPKHFIAPSRFHDMDWPAWFERFSEATFYCVPGMKEDHPELHFQGVLEEARRETWEEEIGKLLVRGIPRLNECVFLHKSSQTLIVADLVFNLSMAEQGFIGKLVLKLLGLDRGLGCSRIFRRTIKDRAAFAESVRQVLNWDFDRVVPGHGAVVEKGGKAEFQKAVGWRKHEEQLANRINRMDRVE